jgi:NADP-dependent 3-hydroxy acid dehydrogenase YdfG
LVSKDGAQSLRVARGIGFETARQFLEEGVRVLIAGRTADKINKARDELAKNER